MIAPKSISNELASLIKKAVESVSDFYDSWAEAVKLGKREGLTVEELQEIARPLLRVKLSTKQVWYLFHQEEQKERSKQQYGNAKKMQDRTNISTNDVKKEPEEKIPPPVVTPEPDYEADYKKDMAKIEAIRAMPRLEPKFTKEDTDINTVVFRMGIEGKLEAAPKAIKDELADYADWIVKDLPMLQRRGWRAVEVTIRVVS